MSFQDLEAGRTFPSRREYINGKQDPTQAVASGVFQINTAISTFQRLVNTLGTPKDTPELREKLRKTRLHIGQLVKDTSAKLKQASDTDQHTEVSASKKIADAKLAKDFQAVLKEFQKAQRLAAERETAYAPFVPQAVLPSSYTASELDISSDKNPEQRAALVESRRQEVLLLDNEIVFNEAIIEEREQGIQEIQQQIGEVNEIFKDLAVLVHEQGAMIDDIDSNIGSSHAATAQAKTQLSKASKTQKSNSSLLTKSITSEWQNKLEKFIRSYFTKTCHGKEEEGNKHTWRPQYNVELYAAFRKDESLPKKESMDSLPIGWIIGAMIYFTDEVSSSSPGWPSCAREKNKRSI